jgi:predicted secreted protein
MRRKTQRVLTGVIIGVVALAVAAVVAWMFRTQLLALIPTPPVVITEQDNGTRVTLLQGQRLEVRLRSNRLSGYRWLLGIPTPMLAQTGEATFTEDSAPAKPGDGVQSTTFLAVNTGTGPLFMSYLPENDQNSFTPEKSFRVTVTIR